MEAGSDASVGRRHARVQQLKRGGMRPTGRTSENASPQSHSGQQATGPHLRD